MMTLKRPAGAAKSGRRVGRGQATGNGCTSGRGNKGQKSRSGYGRKVGFEGGQMPLIRRVPKKGFGNGAFARAYQVVNLAQLNRYNDGDTVDFDALRKNGLVNGKNLHVKLLGKGELTKKLTIVVNRASKTAREAVEKAGGKIEIKG
jgi:large subunit ribosomal protein L15